MTAQPRTVLILTVGGSPEPLRTALREAAASEVRFIVSSAGADQTSSRGQAEALGAEVREMGGTFGILDVPADDPDTAFSRIGTLLDGFSAQQPRPRLLANYTGGTKSMCAALLLAATQRDIEAQITTGSRRDLRQVHDGDERIQSIDTRLINLERDLATALRVAAAGDYGAAAALLGVLRRRIEAPGARPAKQLRVKLDRCHEWATCLAAWDRFDHKAARKILETALDAGFAWAEAIDASGHRAILADLAEGRDEPRLVLCQDLLANAERRRDQHRFDDALGRLYRFTEACLQVQLFRHAGLKSGALPASALPASMRDKVRPGPDGLFRLGLTDTVRVLRHLDRADALAAAFDGNDWGPAWLSARNKSILAHGYRAIDERVVDEALGWINAKVVPAVGMTPMPPFPTSPVLG